MKKILTSNGEWTLVSDEDWLFLVGFSWSVNGDGYACRRVNNKVLRMHRVIAERMGLDCSNEIDHINGIPLDNQRENLRTATHRQNLCNSKRRGDNKSGIKGVHWDKAKQKWLASISVNGESTYLGRFDIKEAAAFAYKIAAKKYHKEFANTGE